MRYARRPDLVGGRVGVAARVEQLARDVGVPLGARGHERGRAVVGGRGVEREVRRGEEEAHLLGTRDPSGKTARERENDERRGRRRRPPREGEGHRLPRVKAKR